MLDWFAERWNNAINFCWSLWLSLYDLLTDRLPHTFTDYFSFPSHGYNTRSTAHAHVLIPKRNLRLGQFSLSYHGAK